MSDYIGKRIVPKHCGEWEKEQSYEMLCIVLDKTSGDSYISRCEVPAGTELTDKAYWALCSDFSQQIKDMSDQLSDTEARMGDDLSTTKETMWRRRMRHSGKAAPRWRRRQRLSVSVLTTW